MTVNEEARAASDALCGDQAAHDTPAPPQLPAILSRSARLQLFVMLRYVEQPAAAKDRLTDHLKWMVSGEKSGVIFLSGPVSANTGTSLVGITVLRVASMAEAERIALDDPFVRCGYVRFELHAWTVYEGAIPFTLTLSDSTVLIG